MSKYKRAMSSMTKVVATLLVTLSFHAQTFSQITEDTNARLTKFLEESSIISFEEVKSEAIEQILKHKVYTIMRKTVNTYEIFKTHEDEFIVLDTGEEIIHFEHNNKTRLLPKFVALIKDDFILDSQTAPLFEDLLDIIYPVAGWKIDKREYIHKNGKWYFLRDAYFRTKQGFEITLDPQGKIIAICYKMKWDEPDRS